MQMQYFGIGFDSAHFALERNIAAYRAGRPDFVDSQDDHNQRLAAMARELYGQYDRTTATKLIHSFSEGDVLFHRLLRRALLEHAGDADWEQERAFDEFRQTMRSSGISIAEAAAEAYVKSSHEFRTEYESELRQIEQRAASEGILR